MLLPVRFDTASYERPNQTPDALSMKSANVYLLGFVLVVASCFDFYVSGLRVADVVVYSVLPAVIFIYRNRCRVTDAVPLFLSVSFVLIYMTLGMFTSTNLKSTVGGAFACLAAISLVFFRVVIQEKWVAIALFFHLSAFVTQWLAFHSYGVELNYHAFTDIEPRLLSSVYRPAGLFYEPAIYGLCQVMLVSLLDNQAVWRKILALLVALSLFASLSMLAIAGALLILSWTVRFNAKVVCLSCGLAALLTYALGDDFTNSREFTFLSERIANYDNDGSAQERYGDFFRLFREKSQIELLFGSGFGAEFDRYGSNGLSAALSQFGLIPCGLGFIAALRYVPMRLSFVSSIGFLLLSAPIYSYTIFAIWVSQLLNGSADRKSKAREMRS